MLKFSFIDTYTRLSENRSSTIGTICDSPTAGNRAPMASSTESLKRDHVKLTAPAASHCVVT